MGVPARPHAVLLPYPALGHIRPFMQLAQCLAHREFIITFVNTEHNHSLILETQQKSECALFRPQKGLDIRLVALPDGQLGCPGQNRTADLGRHTRAIDSYMEPLLEQLIANQRDNPVTCIIYDAIVIPMKRLADKLGITRVPFSTFSVATCRIYSAIESLISNGDVSPNGFPTDRSRLVTSFPGVPKLYTRELPWVFEGICDEDVEYFFHSFNRKFADLVGCKWILCNSCLELEGQTIEMFPKDVIDICPIGPLFGYEFAEAAVDERKDNGTSLSFWAEEKDCLLWLDHQSLASVIYVSFGSYTMLSQLNLQELALGLEASEQPFLWVVRADVMDGRAAELPEGFQDRTKERGRVISWAPQLDVLAHPAVGAFVTHCGWNSTMEGVFNGVPIIAWPYFGDQFVNREYVVGEWKVGKVMEVGEDGMLKKESVEEVVRATMEKSSEENTHMRRRMKELSMCVRACVRKGGSSYCKLEEFVEHMHHLASA